VAAKYENNNQDKGSNQSPKNKGLSAFALCHLDEFNKSSQAFRQDVAGLQSVALQ
jgi:hypothetical protein